jgi:hypothetical protein
MSHPTVDATATLSGISLLKGPFISPSAVATDGTHVWVANYAGNSVTEFPQR